MYKGNKILCIIPARGGSKRLPGKNIKKIGDKPMIAHVIIAARKSKYIDRIVVSTDDNKIAQVAKKFKAEVPFMRPAELADDKAPTLPVLQHAVKFYQDQLDFKPDLVVLIQPTNPLVMSDDIDRTIETLYRNANNSCFTVTEISQRPEWMYHLGTKKTKLFLDKANGPTKRSQDLPQLTIINGAVYAIRYNTLIKKGLIIDNRNTSTHIMPRERSVDIDDKFDFELAKFLMKQQNAS